MSDQLTLTSSDTPIYARDQDVPYLAGGVGRGGAWAHKGRHRIGTLTYAGSSTSGYGRVVPLDVLERMSDEALIFDTTSIPDELICRFACSGPMLDVNQPPGCVDGAAWIDDGSDFGAYAEPGRSVFGAASELVPTTIADTWFGPGTAQRTRQAETQRRVHGFSFVAPDVYAVIARRFGATVTTTAAYRAQHYPTRRAA